MSSNSDRISSAAPFKRQRLTTDNEDHSSSNTSNVGSNELSKSRENCRYGSTCYRRNEAHLLQYRHVLLETGYQLMTERNDFTKFPDTLDVGEGDESALLEQAAILKSAGFQVTSESSRQTVASNSKNAKPEPAPSIPTTQASTSNSASNSPRVNEALLDFFEERRRKMQEKQKASEKIKENVLSASKSASVTRIPGCNSNTASMASKWEASCPFNIFLTKVRDIPVEKDGVYSANFTDLFESSLGEVKALCHINFMVEANWLFEQTIQAGLQGKPTRIIYGDENKELEEGAKAFPWLKIFKVKSPFPYGHHHTKMSLVQYTDESIRIYVYTANLVESDWDNRTQGIWISPRCPKVPTGSVPGFGESVTKFRSDLMEYLSTYPVQAAAAWRDLLKYADCSSIKAYFVASAPITSQSYLNGFQFGIKKMEKILKAHDLETQPDWSLTVQCSSIGTLGLCASDWLINEFGRSMAGNDRKLMGPVNLVYPSDQNVKSSFDGVLGGGCLPYSAMTHMKQRWLDRHMCQWKADCSGRSRAPPHIKSYSRWSADQSNMAWFLLTSANLSKAAWGKINKNGDRLTVMSWEAGVLFIPELICETKSFTVGNANNNANFPLYFDIPLVKYEKKDHPWFFETLQLAISE